MYGDYQREFGQQALRYLFSRQVRPTAVFAASDYLVLGLLDGLRASGLQAPEALSLVGFDDANYADFTQPRISTIRQPARELGPHCGEHHDAPAKRRSGYPCGNPPAG
ncbi:regulatory protein [Klebsiella pneumoniae]|uniref:Regulatory protein n=1 Tax=Klebsiella pneumoniae TaxID=573 RepID=A0A3S4GTE6_KLEPN|nr:regulatory protein [Klebsiella pneumoniae]